MSKQGIGYRDVLELVELIKASTHFSEIRLRQGDLEIELRRQRPAINGEPATAHDQPAASPPANGHPPETTAVQTTAASPRPGNGETPIARSGVTSVPSSGPSFFPAAGSTPDLVVHPPAQPAVRAPTNAIAGAVIIRAPMVGIAYRAPEPGAHPFVEVGQSVGANDQVCIVEVMKLMNSIVADVEGVVAEILFDDGAAVAVGQPLIVIAPHPAR